MGFYAPQGKGRSKKICKTLSMGKGLLGDIKARNELCFIINYTTIIRQIQYLHCRHKCCSLHCMSWLVFSVNLFLVWGGRHPLAVLQGIFLSKKLIGLMSFTVIVPYLSRERGALWSILTLYNYIKLKNLHCRLYPLQCIEMCYKVCLPYLHLHPLSLEVALCAFSFTE